jgi:DNA-binding CsgD family transcriptional regulator
MGVDASVERGREAYRQKQWSKAYAAFLAAEQASPLAPPDFELLTMAHVLLSPQPNGFEIWEAAHHELLRRGDLQRAVRCAFWLGMNLADQGAPARAAGWFSRANRLLDEANLDCVERGYLLIPVAIQSVMAGDPEAGIATLGEAIRIGERFGDPHLVALARQGRGRMLLSSGRTAEGLALFDEIMVAVTSDEVAPLVVGIVFCSVIDALHSVYDIGRAREWTEALRRWCDSQHDLVPFQGQCKVHRAAVLQLSGAWSEALAESVQATRTLAGPPVHPAAAGAAYQEGEVHRLRGDHQASEEAFTRASRLGKVPQPGLALLRLQQGRLDAAEVAINQTLAEVQDVVERAAILPGFVEIMLAAGQLEAAGNGATELERIAVQFDSDYLRALAADATGVVRLSSGNASGALTMLRSASRLWQRLAAPYELARTRELIARACRDLGDADTAGLELAAASEVFSELGAAPDLARVDQLAAALSGRNAVGLTGREVELLALLASGKTNREIAGALVISEKTVARHVSNIFNKLAVSSRSAATAYAFKHDLV